MSAPRTSARKRKAAEPAEQEVSPKKAKKASRKETEASEEASNAAKDGDSDVVDESETKDCKSPHGSKPAPEVEGWYGGELPGRKFDYVATYSRFPAVTMPPISQETMKPLSIVRTIADYRKVRHVLEASCVSVTACYYDDTPLPERNLVIFYRDQQDCCVWAMPDTSAEDAGPNAQLPVFVLRGDDFEDAFCCARSLPEFLLRIWMEDVIWHKTCHLLIRDAVIDDASLAACDLSPSEHDYVEFLRKNDGALNGFKQLAAERRQREEAEA